VVRFTSAERQKKILPSRVNIMCDDASEIDLGKEKFDIVALMTVFSSLLDLDFQEKMAKHVWSFIKPGGGILWYDFR